MYIILTLEFKEKTKSKLRYLKRKKERRKNKPKVSKKKVENVHDEGEDSEEDEDQDEDVAPIIPAQPVEIEKVKRPKKRVRLDEGQAGEEPEDRDEDIEMAAGDVPSHSLPSRTSSTPEPVPTLPSFPLPALPNAPSKEVLALQGLDQALISAEWVSPSTTMSIPTGKDDCGTRLSERTRTRLRDIGITELFAG